jgi:hypothetical protein
MGQTIELRTHGLALQLDCPPLNPDGWVCGQLSVEVPGFRGSAPFFLYRPDLEAFRSQLASMIAQVGRASQAALIGTEPGIDLRLSLDTRGHVEGRYTLRHFDAPGSPALSGTFEMDQTFLAPLLAQVEGVLHAGSS